MLRQLLKGIRGPHQASVRQLDRAQREVGAGLAIAFSNGLRANAKQRSQLIGRDGAARQSPRKLLRSHVMHSKFARLNANRLEGNLPITYAPYDSHREWEAGREPDRECRALVGNLLGLQDVRHAVLKRL